MWELVCEQSTAGRLLAGVFECRKNFDIDGFVDLFAEDGVMEHPTQPPSEATRRMAGREEIRRVLGKVWSDRRSAGFEEAGGGSVAIYESPDAEGIVAEVDRRVKLPDGRIVVLPRVLVMRVRGDQISSLRDYYDFYGHRDLLGLAAPEPR